MEDQLASLEAYVQGIRGALEFLREQHAIRDRPFYVKFHPEQDPEVTARIAEALNGVLGPEQYGVLDDSHIIECLLWNSRNISVLTSFSSSGFYAHQAGHTVFSFARRVAQHDQSYESSLFFLFPDYAKAVIQV